MANRGDDQRWDNRRSGYSSTLSVPRTLPLPPPSAVLDGLVGTDCLHLTTQLDDERSEVRHFLWRFEEFENGFYFTRQYRQAKARRRSVVVRLGPSSIITSPQVANASVTVTIGRCSPPPRYQPDELTDEEIKEKLQRMEEID